MKDFILKREGPFWRVFDDRGRLMSTLSDVSSFEKRDNAVRLLAKCHAVEARRLAFARGASYREGMDIHNRVEARVLAAESSKVPA